MVLSVFVNVFRFAVGCYFVKSGSDKLGKPSLFWKSIMNYDLVNARTARVLSSVIPPLEFFGGLLLAANIIPFAFSVLLVFLLSIFSFAMVAAMMRGNVPDCGCGVVKNAVSPLLVVRNMVLALMLLPTIFKGLEAPKGEEVSIAVITMIVVVIVAIMRGRALVR